MNKFFTSNTAFEREFRRCCEEYDNLEMYIAWIGDPKNVIPFKYLHSLSKINVLVGVAFCQSHPEGIQLLMEVTDNIKIAKEKILYHPKVYIFSNESKKTLFIGSSNLTYQGFHVNHEANVLMEADADNIEIKNFEENLREWLSDDFSFIPTKSWLKKYAERYKKRRDKVKKAGLDDEAEKEEEFSTTAWLANADWDFYMNKIKNGLKNHSKKYEENLSRKLELFQEYSRELSLPWKVEYFDTIEKRRMLLGIKTYGWLGHVGASGNFQHILANGTASEHRTIVNGINGIGSLPYPLDWVKLNKHLNSLVELGPSMKVWGRFLAIVRPDLFCTISAPQVRKNIAKVIGKSENYFDSVEGYLILIRLIHASPWFNSTAPTKKDELEIWKRRVAFLDVVFYE